MSLLAAKFVRIGWTRLRRVAGDGRPYRLYCRNWPFTRRSVV